MFHNAHTFVNIIYQNHKIMNKQLKKDGLAK